jgi:hypothetical protein
MFFLLLLPCHNYQKYAPTIKEDNLLYQREAVGEFSVLTKRNDWIAIRNRNTGCESNGSTNEHSFDSQDCESKPIAREHHIGFLAS